MRYEDYLDENGLMHQLKFPTEESSENEILFTIHFALISYKLKGITEKEYNNFCWRIIAFYLNERDHDRHISHDNQNAYFLACKQVGLKIDQSIFKVGNRVWLHPRDIVYFGYLKFPFIFWFFLWVVMLTNIYSCSRRKRGKDLTTSGKMLAHLRCHGANMKITYFFCTKLIEMNPDYYSWQNTAWLYYTTNGTIPDRGNHPVVKVIDEDDYTNQGRL